MKDVCAKYALIRWRDNGQIGCVTLDAGRTAVEDGRAEPIAEETPDLFPPIRQDYFGARRPR